MRLTPRLRSLLGTIVVALAAAAGGCDAATAPPPDKRGAAPPLETTIERHKEFTCVRDGIQGITDINDVDGRDGDVLAIEPTGTDCKFSLLYKPGGGGVVKLADEGGYLIAVGGVAGNGQAIVCASNIAHRPAEDGKSDVPNEFPHQIEEVFIECTSFDGNAWSPMVRVVEGGSEWAGWVLSLKPASDSGRYQLRYTRDFSFQFMNIGDNGRPTDDGIYDVFLEITPQGPGIVRAQKVSELTNPPGAATSEGWEPTQAELAEHAPYFRPNTGRCPAPNGCPF